MSESIEEIINRRPAVHRLTYGAYLQGHLWVTPKTIAIPLAPMGFDHATNYAFRYHDELLRVNIEPAQAQAIQAQGKDSLPVLSFIYFTDETQSPETMEAEAFADLGRAEQLVGWISGDYLQDFAFVIAATDRIYIRLLPPHSQRRQMLGPGNVGPALQSNITNILQLAEKDERFAYALSLHRDALHEPNKLFKIARLFNVLEALAYALKVGGVGSRDAVRKLLGLESGALGQISYAGKTISYDRIALAGQLRDRVFHGSQFTRDQLPAAHRDSFDVLNEQPDALIRDLLADCELEFARWGNNASAGRTAAETRKATTS